MIGFLKGRLHNISDNLIVIDVNGVGYEVLVPTSIVIGFPEIGEMLELEIHTQSGEAGISLYGFKTLAEKTLFQKLISVSGIGPKTAIGILSDGDPTHIIKAITLGDTAQLTRFNGIGKKTAERLILELKDKLSAIPVTSHFSQTAPKTPQVARNDDAIEALISLGYADFIARKAVASVDISANDNVQSVLKRALASLNRA